MIRTLVLFDSSLPEPLRQMATEALQSAATLAKPAAKHSVELQCPATDLAAAADQAASADYARILVAVGNPGQHPAPAAKAKWQPVAVAELIRHPEQALGIDLPKSREAASPISASSEPAAVASSPAAAPATPAAAPIKLVAVTSCPTGIAHTFMAAAALEKAAKELGYQIRIETQGSVGAKNPLTVEEIADCTAAIIAADRNVDASRFAAVPLLSTSTKDAIHHGKDLIARALAVPRPSAANSSTGAKAALSKVDKKPRTGFYKHLMNGVSHMLPLVTAGGLLIALAFAIGGIHAGDHTGTLGWALMQIGGGTAFKLYVAILSAYIAYSIADRPGLCSGLVGGMLSMSLGAGFLGGILAGFLAGYTTKLLNDKLPLPESLAGLKPVLILPVLSTLIVGLAMLFVIGAPVKFIFDSLTAWLSTMQQGSALALGLLLGGMMAFDMGGPINKAAYTFSVGMLASGVHEPIAATMAAGMTPPLGIYLATLLFKKRFTADERSQGKVTAILGLSFVTEGAIPYAATDPLRVLPALIAGSALTGAISMASGCGLMVPHGGAFVLLIPNAVTKLSVYSVGILAGTVLTALLLGVLKRKPAEA